MNNNKRQIYFRAVKVKFVSVPRQPTSDVRSMCVRARCVCESLMSFYDARWHPLGVMRKRGIFDISRLPRERFSRPSLQLVFVYHAQAFFSGVAHALSSEKEFIYRLFVYLTDSENFSGLVEMLIEFRLRTGSDRASLFGREDQYLWDHMIDVMMGVSDNHFLMSLSIKRKKMFANEIIDDFPLVFVCLISFSKQKIFAREWENPQTQMMMFLRCINSFFSLFSKPSPKV